MLVETCCTDVLVGASDIISVVDICDTEITMWYKIKLILSQAYGLSIIIYLH